MVVYSKNVNVWCLCSVDGELNVRVVLGVFEGIRYGNERFGRI